MVKSFVVVVVMLVTCTSRLTGQDMVAKYEAHEFHCDGNGTTLEINICSGEKLEYADSLLNLVYKRILQQIDKDIKEWEKLIREPSKDGSVITKENLTFLKKDIDHSKRMKQSIIASQREWIKVRDLNAAAVRLTCEGGTACVAITNESIIADTLDRIKTLQANFEL